MHLLATSVTKWHLQGQKQDLGISALVRAKKNSRQMYVYYADRDPEPANSLELKT